MTIRTDLSINWEADPRIITVDSPSTEIEMQDLLDTLRSEESDPANVDNDSIVDAAGKEDLGGGVKVGLTVTLQNAKVAFEARSGPTYTQCNVSGGNLVAIDSVGSSMSAIEPTAFTQVVLANSSSATLQEQSALQYSSYGGGVSVDVLSAYTGTDYPTGTPQQRVNNMDDALLIAAERGFTTFFITGDLDIDDTNDYSGFNFVGESQTKSEITIAASADVERCEFYECHVSGTLDGQCVLKSCIVDDLNYINGVIEQCILEPGTITLGGGAQAYLIDCWSGVATSGTPVIDMGGTGQSLIVRNYNGYLGVKNLSDQNQKATIDLNSGEIHLESSLTDGTVIVRGVGSVIDESGGAIVDDDNLVNPTTVKNSVYTGGIDGNVSLQNALQVILAALAGPASGGGTSTLAFQNQAKTKNILTMSVDENGNRSVVILNPD